MVAPRARYQPQNFGETLKLYRGGHDVTFSQKGAVE